MEGKIESGRPPPPNPAMPYREDCWSEGATSVLIDAWGERFLDLTRGNLRQKHWEEVADTVNSRKTVVRRPHRTDVQCKNRIDTIKKKFKVEKGRVVNEGGFESQWPFYDRLDALIGNCPPPPLPSSSSAKKKKKKRTEKTLVNDPSHKPLPLALSPPPVSCKRPASEPSLKWGRFSAAAAAAAAARDDDPDSEASSSTGGYAHKEARSYVRKNGGFGRGIGEETMNGNGNENGSANGNGIMELAMAINKMGEIYEKVEMSRQKQEIEIEKERLAFNKDMELRKMNLLIKAHVEMRKIKRAKLNSVEGSS
ncbi:putative Transcription factor [Zostera marina]|uniref:Putative Transcription factor n=1 Tax=Zostera marina TaxID=29655 RepID=A0A0K9PD77_ZOSMR|nr:putative Transcription factor [Zostera marina]